MKEVRSEMVRPIWHDDGFVEPDIPDQHLVDAMGSEMAKIELIKFKGAQFNIAGLFHA